jgi:small-conductance mechanosensitive channel
MRPLGTGTAYAALRAAARWKRQLTLISATLLLAVMAAAQNPPAPAKSYPVTLEGAPVFEVQWGHGNFSPQYRASLITEKLKRIADDPTIKPEISLLPNEMGIDMLAGDVLLGSVFPGDATAAGVSKEDLAQRWRSAMERSMIAYRARYSWQRRVARGVAALLLIGLCAVLFLAVRRGTHALSARTVARLQAQIQKTQRQVLTLIPNSHIDKVVPRLFRLLRITLYIVIVVVTFQLLLWLYPPTRYLAGRFIADVAAPLKTLGAKFWANAPNLFLVLIIAIATWYVLRFLRFFFNKIADGTLRFARFKPRWAETTKQLVNILVVICALLVAYPYIPGSESPAFKGITLFIGVLASIGSAGVVPNMISGIMLTYMDPFEVGDLVRIGDTQGVVHETSILSTTLRSRATELITIPNSMIWNNHITNFSRRVSDGSSLVTRVGIGYDAPWRQVEAILKTAAARTAGVRATPEPYVHTASLEQFNVNYELHAFVDTGTAVYKVQSELNENILDACNEFGVQIMTPSYEGDPERAKLVRKEEWFAAPAAAANTDARGAGAGMGAKEEQGPRKVA